MNKNLKLNFLSPVFICLSLSLGGCGKLELNLSDRIKSTTSTNSSTLAINPTQQILKLVGTGVSVGQTGQGDSVALSADGNTAIVGAGGDASSMGAAWIYTRTAGVWSQQGQKLVGTGSISTSNQGNSVAISADGNTAMVGGPGDNNIRGGAWIFIRTAGVWSQQSPKLVGTGSVGSWTFQGISVALSADGNTAMVGGYGDNSNRGAVWVYTRTAGVWSQQGAKVVGTGGVGGGGQGTSVSLSSDGNTAIVGAFDDNSSKGAVWILTRTAGVWSQQGSKLVGTGAVGNAQQGYSVSLSSDGNTAIVGGYGDNTNVGAVWIYTRSAGVWSQQGSKLVGTGAVGNAQQGSAVFISSDSNTVMVGSEVDDSNLGAVWVYTRTAGVWSQQGSKLMGTGAVGSARQGTSVALSGDGNTAIVGGFEDNSNAGAVWIFIRTAGVWSQQGSKLVGTGSFSVAKQGFSVALSNDGNTAIVGGFYDFVGTGAVWIFTRTAGVWSQQGSKLVGTGAVGFAQQGYSVSLSGDGNTAMVGGYADNSNAGAVWIYTRTAGVWSQQGSKLVGTGVIGSARQGYSVSLSSDGNTAIVGGYGDSANVGAAWIFTRTAGVWSQQGSKLVGTGVVGSARQGSSVSISADSNTVAVGANGDNTNQGAAWIYTRTAGVWSQQGSKLVGTGSIGQAEQGHAVALNGDGNILMVGGYSDNSNVGATWVFARTAGFWTQKDVKFEGPSAIGSARQGSSVSMSNDGSVAITGGDSDDTAIGAAWLFAP